MWGTHFLEELTFSSALQRYISLYIYCLKRISETKASPYISEQHQLQFSSFNFVTETQVQHSGFMYIKMHPKSLQCDQIEIQKMNSLMPLLMALQVILGQTTAPTSLLRRELPLLLVKFLQDLMMQTTILTSIFMVILLHVVLEQWKIKVMVQFCRRLAYLDVVVLILKPF